jgi:hypothetical protein
VGLTEYLDRARTQTAAFSTLKVSQASGRPTLFLPPAPERSDLPEGWTDVFVENTVYSGHFVKIALNIVRKSGDEENHLRKILRRWFGPDAGAPGTRHSVALERGQPVAPQAAGPSDGELQLWRSYSREEIPPLFGFEFSTAIWNAGFVKRPGHIFLLATLDKSGHGSEFQYRTTSSAEASSSGRARIERLKTVATAEISVSTPSEDSPSTCLSVARRRWRAAARHPSSTAAMCSLSIATAIGRSQSDGSCPRMCLMPSGLPSAEPSHMEGNSRDRRAAGRASKPPWCDRPGRLLFERRTVHQEHHPR